ncbi:M16 family metallopeptidase [Lunatimonas salinarum]|uniref:M16 family metallopeptidase n=1 Tax=Lunatimonas salinarum TaxID=1774590 RepID=UPI001AE07841|nr:pitrilysin family protein [Lunatimonas salinarum]
MPDRRNAPPFQIPDQIELREPERKTLGNGIPMYFIRTPQVDAVRLEIMMPSVGLPVSLENSLVPFFTLNMLLEGTREMNSSKLDDFFDYFASEVEIHTGYEQQGLSLLTTRKHFREVLPVFRSLFTEATFPEKELQKRKSQKKLTINLQFDQTGARGNQLIRRVLFGENHPFGFISDEDHVDAVTKESIHEYYDQYFRVSPEIFVTGNLGDRELLEIERNFGDLPFGEGNYATIAFDTFPEKRLVETRPSAVQSSIRLGKILVPKSNPDFFALMIANTALGGYFGSRLVKNIREEKGYTYGISSFLGSLRSTDYWMVLADIKMGFAEQTIEEIYRELELLSSVPMDEDEQTKVKNYLIGNLLSQFSSPFDLMTRFKRVHLQGLDYSFYEKQLHYIKTFSAKEIMVKSKTYFNPETIKEVIVGP